ncbi:hypothetical protein BAY06_03905 [Elizabethkingia anophelis]|uniref:hypothetical protein n=1 Tax=Elizabethkingia anophelis TaxID=1117645 RepID=UPI000999D42C|nr:hypothetical protein [Elizabethkingia anophelis]OPC51481.1 hypothetical protein BAY06_03905 [Elizabethkingia anophelis]
MNATTIKISQLLLNEGQIEGLPRNPRFIRDARFMALVKSIKDLPEMLELRELIVVPFRKKFVVIGGNMRLRVITELGYTEASCKVLKAQTPAHILREIAIKDNISFGNDDSDALANEWDKYELDSWGYEFPVFEDLDEDEEPEDKLPKEEDNKISIVLDESEMEVWLQAKEHMDLKNDKKAIFRLIQFMYDYENQG